MLIQGAQHHRESQAIFVYLSWKEGGFPHSSAGKESACNAGDLGSIPGLGRSPGGVHSSPLQYSCLENPHGQKSLAGYSPWRCKESDMTERLKHSWKEVHPSTQGEALPNKPNSNLIIHLRTTS